MVFGKLLEYAENEGRRLVPDLFYKKKIMLGKTKWSET